MVSIERYRRPAVADGDATPTGIAAGVGAWVMIVAGVVAATIPDGYPGWRFGVIAVAVMAFAAVSLDQTALAVTAVTGALIFNEFLEDRFGRLV
jgi:hypothetical protein